VGPLLSRGAPVVSGAEGGLVSEPAVPPGSFALPSPGLSNRAQLRLTQVTIVALTLFIMVWSLVYHLPGPAFFYLQVTANLFMAPTLVAVVGGLYWRRASAAGAAFAFVLGALTSLAYLVPSLRVGVATAGNLSWALAVGGFVAGSVLVPSRPVTGGAEKRP